MVGDIEELRTELQPQPIRKREVLINRQVEVDQARSRHYVLAGISVGERRRNSKSRCVKPAGDSMVAHMPVSHHIRPAAGRALNSAGECRRKWSSRASRRDSTYLPAADDPIEGAALVQ